MTDDLSGEHVDVENVDIPALCDQSLEWAREREYAGYDPYDGLNSPILSKLARGWIPRLVAIHGVRAAPVNLRPYLGVPRQRNPKGIGLFARAYLNRYEQTGNRSYLDEAETLLEWLATNQSPAFERPSWGYNFDWQNSNKFFLPADHPCGVVTIFCARSFLHHYRLTGTERSLELASGAAEFLLSDINEERVDGFDVLAYTPYDSYVVVNANALAADYLRHVGEETGNDRYLERARELFEFVVEMQTPEGGWYYAVPGSESHIDHDNFHTGFVLESLHDYAVDRSPSHPAREAYERGIQFHRNVHFEPDGAPKFEHNQSYPYDIHAAAQAIITFTVGDDGVDSELAGRVLRWTIDNMFDSDGYFYRRIGRVLNDTTPYMRWSQAWMCVALTEYVETADVIDREVRVSN